MKRRSASMTGVGGAFLITPSPAAFAFNIKSHGVQLEMAPWQLHPIRSQVVQ